MTRIGIFLFDCVDEMDVAGPWEVLTTWQFVSDPSCPCAELHLEQVDVFTFALPRVSGEQERIVRCAKGMRIVPDQLWDSACRTPEMDVLIYPGGPDMSAHWDDQHRCYDPRYREVATSAAEKGAVILGVCVGALALARFGLLSSRRATTHWLAIEDLVAADSTIRVEPSRFVDEGAVITSAGISAGIDAALHLVARFDSPRRAREVRRFLEYDPAPPVSLLGNRSEPPWAVSEKPEEPKGGHPASLYQS